MTLLSQVKRRYLITDVPPNSEQPLLQHSSSLSPGLRRPLATRRTTLDVVSTASDVGAYTLMGHAAGCGDNHGNGNRSKAMAVAQVQGNRGPNGEHDRAKRGFDSVDGEYLS